MEQRIKIVWIFSIASILLITCGQVYLTQECKRYTHQDRIDTVKKNMRY